MLGSKYIKRNTLVKEIMAIKDIEPDQVLALTAKHAAMHASGLKRKRKRVGINDMEPETKRACV
mgnify:CR=1 FL=1